MVEGTERLLRFIGGILVLVLRITQGMAISVGMFLVLSSIGLVVSVVFLPAGVVVGILGSLLFFAGCSPNCAYAIHQKFRSSARH